MALCIARNVVAKPRRIKALKKAIIGFHKDEENHWVARLACGHNQHVRHNPPMSSRPWVLTEVGRRKMIGYELNCKKCDSGDAKDF